MENSRMNGCGVLRKILLFLMLSLLFVNTSGIYQYSRNPAFLAFDMIYVGVLLMFFCWGCLE